MGKEKNPPFGDAEQGHWAKQICRTLIYSTYDDMEIDNLELDND